MATNNTKEKIIELARNHMMQLGYHSFNYKMIATELNIKNSAIHHYFPNKEDLGLAVITKDRADFEELVKSIEDETVEVKIETILKLYKTYFKTNNNLCLAGTFGSSYADIPERLQLGSSQNLTLVNDWLEKVLDEGKRVGLFNFTGSAADISDLWITMLTGSLIIGRLKGEPYFTRLQQTLRSTIKF